ncbi:MAG: lipopolysaccharide kinase InaA family protein [Bacteroidota bacterium]|nr:lipopolysaccharide kinase InaA family protein [Bacteroidota bacterium]
MASVNIYKRKSSMKFIVAKDFTAYLEDLERMIQNFSREGSVLSTGRNEIRIFDLNGKSINVKAFKIPNAVNKIAYRFFRKSKAQRSFEYASILTQKGIGTPLPIAYAEENRLTFGRSFYLCEHLDCELTFRDLSATDVQLLQEFTRFTFQLHEKEIEFLDHSPGNTLIRRNAEKYQFFLVDLNRMNFRKMDFEARMKNFSRLTSEKAIVQIMAAEYATLIGKPEDIVFDKMWFYTNQFQEKFQRKKRLKKKLKFWKS